MKKKKILVGILIPIISLILISGVLIFIGLVPIPQGLLELFDNNELTDLEKIEEIIQTTHPTDIVVLGDDITFEGEIKYRKVDNAEQETLQRKGGLKYTVLIVNDLNNKVQLTEDEKVFLKQKIKEEGFCLMYLGEKYSSTWDEQNQAIANVAGNLYYGYYSVEGSPRRTVGAWMVEYQEALESKPTMLGNSILYSIESFLKEIG